MITALSLLASTSAFAQDAEQYRSFKLSDGREFTAIILATEAAGFKVRVPQGEMQVPFAQLFDMVPVTRAEYDAQPDWIVYLAAPPERYKGLAGAFESIPHVNVYGGPEAPSGTRITPEMEAAAAPCEQDVDCLMTALAGAPWVWIVTAKQEGSDFVFAAQTNQGTPRQNPVRAGMINPEQIAAAPWNVLELTPVEKVGPTVIGPEPGKTGGGSSSKLAFVPVPGMPALANGDMAGFGIAMAAVVPATALWVGAVGKNTQSGVGLAALGLGGYYAITVAVNQAVGQKAAPASDFQVGVVPTEGGGAALTVSGRR